MDEQELRAVEEMLAAGLEAEFRALNMPEPAEHANTRVRLWRDLLDPELDEEEEDATLAGWVGRALPD